MGVFAREDGRVRTKRSWLLLAALVSVVGGLVPFTVFALALFWTRHYAAGLAVVPYFGLEYGLLHLWNRKWLERRGRLRADDRGLWLDDELVVGRAVLGHGVVLRRGGVVRVRLARMFQPVEVIVEDEDEAAALLGAMRLDAPRSVGSYTMNHGTDRSAWIKGGVGVVVVASVLFGAARLTDRALPVITLLGAASVVAMWWSAAQYVRVSVGADGIHLRRFPWRSRFIPFGALDGADIDGRDVSLRLRDGSLIAMHHPSSGEGWKPLLYRDQADVGRMLVERITRQAEQHRRGVAGLGMLARGARTTRDWLRDVAVASDEHASFRAPAVPAAELWRIVEDPAAATTERAGAAVALRERLDESGRSRLRLAADACAAPKLRLALGLVASGVDAGALEDALDELHDGDERTAARA